MNLINISRRTIDRDSFMRKRIETIVGSEELEEIRNEKSLASYLIQHQNEIPCLKDYPYVHAYEYEIIPGQSHYGKGDLILTDGRNHFLVIELKFLKRESGPKARKKRYYKRKLVWEQARKYAIYFKISKPSSKVKYSGITNYVIWNPSIRDL